MPDEEALTLEAQVAVDDISDVHPNKRAEAHLTAYKQRILPIIHGDVIQVSADRLTEPKTNNPCYAAFVRIDQDELIGCPTSTLSGHADNPDDTDSPTHGIPSARRGRRN